MSTSSSISAKTEQTDKSRRANPAGRLAGRLVEVADRGVALLVRQSSKTQKTGNIGSGYFQFDQLHHLKLYGIDPERADVFDLRGETGRANAKRPDFRDFLEKIRAGLYGVVIATLTDRVARNKSDLDEVVQALANVDGMLVVNGRIYDPTDPGHRLILGILAQIARHDNEMRVLRSLTSKVALSRRLELVIPLPTGLVWASPQDPTFLEALRREGLESCVEEKALGSHKAVARRKDGNLYILPFPDEEVQRALRLLLEWLLETRDLGTVLDRIEKGEDGWPRAGCFPIYQSRRYDASKIERCRQSDGLWKRIVGREDGRNELARGTLRDFLSSPALYGTYAYECEGLSSISRHAAEISKPVSVEEAFPGIYDPDVREQVEQVLAEAVSFRIRGTYDGPRNHALPIVRCASFLPDGSRCGLRKSAVYRSRDRGRHRYQRPACGERGHQSDCVDRLDQLVIDLVKDAYSVTSLEESLARVRQSRSRTEEQRRRLQRALEGAEARLRAAAGKAESARTEGDRTLEQVFDRRVKEHHETLRGTRRALLELDASDGEASVSRRERKRLLALAADVPRLIDLISSLEKADGGRLEGAMRRLLKVLISRVHVRRLGAFCYGVQVEFPSGITRGQVLFSRRIAVPQAALAYAYVALGDKAGPTYRSSLEREQQVRDEAEEIARCMNEVTGRGNLPTEWTAERVLTAALAFDAAGKPAGQHTNGCHVDIEQLAGKLELDADRVLGAALRGELGAAQVCDGQLQLMPSESHLHKAFPDSARIQIASRQGWPIEKTILLASLREEDDCGWEEAEQQANKAGGIVRDAAGRRWCRRPAEQGERSILERALDRHRPAQCGPGDGEWLPLKEVLRRFRVYPATAKKHGVVVRPGFGYLGSRSIYIWVDDAFRSRLP